MGRNAYLIICHNNFSILEKLFSLLDDPLNDIYIHVDRKVGSITELKMDSSFWTSAGIVCILLKHSLTL